MLSDLLRDIVSEGKRNDLNNNVIRNLLKDALQYYVLDFIYNYFEDNKYLYFTGGTALRMCHGLNRLSEDIDLDNGDNKIDKELLAKELVSYFISKKQFEPVEYNISGKGEKIYLKFPILQQLGAAGPGESDKLYVKVEIEDVKYKNMTTELFPLNKYELNFLVKKYDLPSLMTNKFVAVLERTFARGKGDAISFKGRDYYDLIWYMQKRIEPNLKLLQERTKLNTVQQLLDKIEKKIKTINPQHLRDDLINLFVDTRFVNNFCENYRDIFMSLKKEYLSS